MGISIWSILKNGLYVMDVCDVYTSSSKFSSGINYLMLINHLDNIIFDSKNTIKFFYEKVMAHNGVHAAHKYGAYEAFIHYVCSKNSAPDPIGIPVGTWKKQVIGKGNAKKEEIKAFIINYISSNPQTFASLITKDLQSLTYDECDAIAMGIYVSQIGVNNVPN